MADISNIVVNNTLYNIKDANAVHTPLKTINGKTITGSGNIALNARARRIWYGTCTSSSATKTVTTATEDFTLTNGNMLVVRFSYNETPGTVTSLKVDGTTATLVYTTLNTNVQDGGRWAAYSMVSFVYYDSKFIMVNSGHATVSVYGKVRLLPTWSVTSQGSTSTTGYDGVTSNALSSLYDYVNTKMMDPSGGGYSLTLGSEFAVYGSSELPRVFKMGNIVWIEGCVTPVSDISGGDTNHLICTLSEGYRPQQTFYCIMQGSTRNKWQLTIGSGGSVYFSRQRTIGSWTTCSAGSWLPFNATWIAAE